MKTTNRLLKRPFAAAPRTQRGVVLMISLIVLVALTLAGLSMVRTVDTGSVIAGNFSFKQASLQSTEAGMESAFQALGGLGGIVATSVESTSANRYYAIMQSLDTNGVPTGIDWSAAPTASAPAGFTARYVIERMCTGSAPVTDIAGKCLTEAATDTGSKKPGAPKFTGALKVNYRVTVRVEGPRNTLSIAQGVVAY